MTMPLGVVTMTALPRMPASAKAIICEVLAEHHIGIEDFYSQYRDSHLVAARKQAARRLLDRKYSATRVGRMLRRNHATILNYIDKHAQRKQQAYASKRVLMNLSQQAKEYVIERAASDGLTTAKMIAKIIEELALADATVFPKVAA